MEVILAIYKFFEMMLNERHLPAFLSGIAAGIGLVWLAGRFYRDGGMARLIRLLRDQIAEMKGQNDRLRAESEGFDSCKVLLEDQVKSRDGQVELLRQQLIETSAVCERQAAEAFEMGAKLKLERKTRREAARLAAGYAAQLDDITNSDGKIWLKAANGSTPPFVPLQTRKAAIISLANLKGGVGKTTMTANLGAAFASQGLRVLMIDLDHQSSLTNICLTEEEKEAVVRSNRYIDVLFERGGDLAALNGCVTRLQTPTAGGQLYLAPVTEGFTDLENRLMTRWHSGLTQAEDVRFRLRTALHSPRLRQYYDVVLIDCPPRLTTGSINALAASDYVLIPVLLEQTSADGVPRILGWLKKFQTTSCADLNVLGVVGNKAYPRAKLIAREQTVWNLLREKCQDAWGSPVPLFDEIIREHAASGGMFAALDPRYQSGYSNLTHLIRREIPHAHLEPSAVHPVAGASALGRGD